MGFEGVQIAERPVRFPSLDMNTEICQSSTFIHFSASPIASNRFLFRWRIVVWRNSWRTGGGHRTGKIQICSFLGDVSLELLVGLTSLVSSNA